MQISDIMNDNPKKKILVVGSANTDLVIQADHFPLPGETMFGHSFMSNHGGKGANQAVAAARLGGDTAFIGKVGSDDFGRSTLEALRAEGIDTRFVGTTAEQSSGIAIITTIDTGENTIVLDAGANSLLLPADIRKAEELFAQCGTLLMQLETPVEGLVEAAALAKKYGAYVVLNPAPAPKEPLPEELLRNVDLLIPNETEAAYISGVEVGDEESLAKAMDKIQQLGVSDVIITVGSRGVYARIGGRLLLVPAHKVKAVDTTAAGDTFCGALCVALSRGEEMEQAIDFANRAAAISVTRRGAQMSMPHADEMK